LIGLLLLKLVDADGYCQAHKDIIEEGLNWAKNTCELKEEGHCAECSIQINTDMILLVEGVAVYFDCVVGVDGVNDCHDYLSLVGVSPVRQIVHDVVCV
jgi:hypothetical protein